MNTLQELLIQSYRKGDLSQLKSLIIKGVDIHARDDYAFRWAARNGHLEVVKYLVEDCDADVHAYDDHAVRWSAERGHLEIVKYLVEECGADVRNKDDYALRWAALNGHLEVVKYLVSKGANVRVWNDFALRLAAQYGHLEVVKYLVEDHDANVHSNDEEALRWAAENGHLDVVKYLKSYIVLQFTKKHIDKQNLRYVFQQYELPFEIQQIISSYVLKKPKTKVGLTIH